MKIYKYLVGKGIIVRNRDSVSLCGNCLRVTVGTRGENEKLIEALKMCIRDRSGRWEADLFYCRPWEQDKRKNIVGVECAYSF